MTDFMPAEFESRLAKIQSAMLEKQLDAILLCTEAEIRYFTGFRTQFWQSPSRPWFVVIPQTAKPIAIIPGIGAQLMRSTWVEDIRTWSSPNPIDEGVSLLLEALSSFRKVGMPMGFESSLRMPLLDFQAIQQRSSVEFIDCSALIHYARMVKSDAEIAIIKRICKIGSSAFAQAPALFNEGLPLDEAFRKFKIALLNAGAEDVPYLVGAAGKDGYGDVISPPDSTPLNAGDVLMLDTGASLEGYFCDFDRNFVIGYASDRARAAYDKLWSATEAGLDSATAGTTCAELFHCMHKQLSTEESDVGRYGHGLGMQLTEFPSIAAFDHTVLQAGMVITLEPSLMLSAEKMMVFEENILITENKPVLLTERAATQLPVVT